MEPERAAHDVAERAARTAYGRLVALLALRTRDVAAAEDALGDAFLAALRDWPRTGPPANPEAWLFTAARRRLLDAARHDHVHAAALDALRSARPDAPEPDEPFPDERLRLLFLCAHPAIDAAVRTPLMLQTVLGLDAARIASAFLVAPAAMSQRLVRAKAKIRDARPSVELPPEDELPGRLGSVLEAIYATYGTGWDDVAGSDPRRKGLAGEAVWLARVLVGLMPNEPEARGLLALMLFCESRRGARRDAAGGYVPLSEQDVSRWSFEAIREAERELTTAASAGRVGAYQLEAAIQSVHARRAVTGRTDWEAVALLYEGLIRFAPSVGALVGRAAALGEARGAADGLTTLELVPHEAGEYQPWWALRAHLLARVGRVEESAAAYRRAAGLTEDPSVRAFLLDRLAGLTPPRC